MQEAHLDRDQVTLQIQTAAEGVTDWQPIAPGDVLHKGDRFELKLAVGRAAYVYVLQRDGKKPVDILLPAPGETQHQLQPNLPAHLPADGGWFRLFDDPGEETLYAVAATSPLAQEQVAQELEHVSKEALGGREPPPTSSGGNRGFDTVRRVLWGRMDSRGIAVLRFSFRHE